MESTLWIQRVPAESGKSKLSPGFILNLKILDEFEQKSLDNKIEFWGVKKILNRPI